MISIGWRDGKIGWCIWKNESEGQRASLGRLRDQCNRVENEVIPTKTGAEASAQRSQQEGVQEGETPIPSMHYWPR
jgi:hypothetical protein